MPSSGYVNKLQGPRVVQEKIVPVGKIFLVLSKYTWRVGISAKTKLLAFWGDNNRGGHSVLLETEREQALEYVFLILLS